MNTLTLQKQSIQMEKFLKRANRALLEFEVAQVQWDVDHGRGKVYSSVSRLMSDVMGKKRK